MKKIDLGQTLGILANVGVVFGILLLAYELNQNRQMMEAQTGRVVWGASSTKGGIDLHVELAYGHNVHHSVEAIFKALGRALDQATRVDSRIEGPLSTKGTL